MGLVFDMVSFGNKNYGGVFEGFYEITEGETSIKNESQVGDHVGRELLEFMGGEA